MMKNNLVVFGIFLVLMSHLTHAADYFSDNTEISQYPWPMVKNIPAQKKKPASTETVLSTDYKSKTGFSVIRDPRLLEALEAAGYSLQHLFGEAQYPMQNQEFAQKNTLYKSIVEILGSDLDQLMTSENKVSGESKSGVGMSFSKRIFDQKWFSSSFGKYELVGVLNRLDRVSFKPHSCGETRFIYRLSYQSGKVYSRLPMTLLVKFANYGDSTEDSSVCRKVAHHWVYPPSVRDNDELVRWFTSDKGPLSTQLLDRKSVV